MGTNPQNPTAGTAATPPSMVGTSVKNETQSNGHQLLPVSRTLAFRIQLQGSQNSFKYCRHKLAKRHKTLHHILPVLYRTGPVRDIWLGIDPSHEYRVEDAAKDTPMDISVPMEEECDVDMDMVLQPDVSGCSVATRQII